jgi:hypothetical protein
MAFDLSRWFFRKRLEAAVARDRGSVTSHRVANPYHAVSIQPGPAACGPARRLRDRRFLSAEAPALPLEGCDEGRCTCRYRHHDDRRQDPRRASDRGFPLAELRGGERRVGHGRRVTDL